MKKYDTKEKQAEEKVLAKKELAIQNEEKEKRAAELVIAYQKLAFLNNENEKRAEELIKANKELAFQYEEKNKRVAELAFTNRKLVNQHEEKEKRVEELALANRELVYQHEEKKKRAAELVIANKELVFQHEEKEKRAAELITSETRYRRLFESAKDGILILDAETGMIVDVNAFLIELLGYSYEAFLGKAIWDIGFFKYIVANKDNYLELQQKEYIRYEDLPLETSDGRMISVEFVSNVYLVDNQKVIQCNIRDITERKLVEEALRESEEFLSRIIESSNDCIKVLDMEGNLLSMSAGGQRILEIDDITVYLNKSWVDFWKGKDKENACEAISKAKKGDAGIFTGYCETEKGTPKWWEIMVSPIKDAQRNIVRLLAISRDITERKRAEDEIKSNDKTFKELIESLPQLFWTCRVDGPCDYLSKQWVEYTGIPEAEQLGYRWLEQLHPDDKDRTVTEWLEKVKTVNSFDIEFRIRRKDGMYRWFKTRAVPIRDINDNILKWFGSNTDIEDIIKAEEALLETRDRLIEAQAIAHLGSWEWDSVKDEIKGSEEFYRLFDVNPDGLDLFRFAQFAKRLHPDDLERVKRDVADSLKQNLPYNTDYRVKLGDGSWRNINAVGHVFTDTDNQTVRMVGTCIDITERKQAEEALREKELIFRNVFDNSPLGKSMTGIDGTMKVNRAFSEIVGYSEEELQKKIWKEITYPDDIQESSDIIESMLNGKIDMAHYEKRYIHKNGNIVWTDITTAVQKDEKGKNKFFITTIQDITQRKKSEEEILRLNEELERRVIQRTELLEQANKELEAFSYSVSHDLRAPLRGIDGFSLALYEDYQNSLDDTAKDYIKRIRAGTKKMDVLIDSLLKLSRVSRFEMNFDKVDLSLMVKEISEDLKSADKTRKAKFIIEENLTVKGDSNLLKIVLENLLNNAWKFTSKKDKTIIEFGAIKENSKIVYFIRDNGVGFDMKYSNKLFSAFQRLHSEKEFPGTGIGLTTVQRIIRRHNGDVRGESKLNEVTTFYFTL